MSSVLSELAKFPWPARLPRPLRRLRASKECWIHQTELDAYRRTAQVANELMGHIEIWVVEASVELLAHIACWHRQIEAYRGHLLCSDAAGHVFLIDLQSWEYVKTAATHLLQIDGVDQARQMVDALWEHREKGGEHAAAR